MGTVASIDLPHAGAGDSLAEQIRLGFDEAEARFSLYRQESELSRVAAGSLALTDASVELRDAYAVAMEWHLRTAGAFTPNRPDGTIDLNGVVKAMCIDRAGQLLEAAGIDDWSINVGGDISCAGTTGGESWTAGIVDPLNRKLLLATVPLGVGRTAIATSGSAERGDHIWLLDRDRPAEFIQVTVVAADILVADVLATAIISGGRETLDLATDRWPIDVLAVARDGALLATPGLRSARSMAENEWAG